MQALFIHGMGRSPLSGWPLVRRLRAKGVHSSSFAYIAAVQDFAQISTRLAARIEALAHRDDYVLIGHSLGGVLLRSAMAALSPGTRPPSRVFLLGSPVQPSRLAVFFQRNPLYRLITDDCGQLLASEDRMNGIPALSVPTTAILGEHPISLTARLFVGEANDGIVSESETRADWIGEKISVPVMHSFLAGNPRVAELILARV